MYSVVWYEGKGGVKNNSGNKELLPSGLGQGSPTPSPGLQPVRNQATQQEVSGRQASEASFVYTAAPHHSNPPPPIHGKIVFYETGPWCQKGWGSLGQVMGEIEFWGRGQILSLKHAEFEIAVRYPSEDVEETVGCINLEFQMELQAGEKNLGDLSYRWNLMKLYEITKELGIGREEEQRLNPEPLSGQENEEMVEETEKEQLVTQEKNCKRTW